MTAPSPDQPNPSLIYDLYTGIFRPQIIRLALQLDVFTPLAGGPADALTVARACGCHPAAISQLLEVLASAQVLTRQAGRYALTPSAATFLVRGRPAYAGDLILAWTGPAIWESTAQAVRSGVPTPFEEYHEQDAWLESYSEGRLASSLGILAFHKRRYKQDRDYQLWQEGSHPQRIQGIEMMQQKVAYIHHNPVKRGWVDEPTHWRYSSARNYAGLAGLLDVQTEW